MRYKTDLNEKATMGFCPRRKKMKGRPGTAFSYAKIFLLVISPFFAVFSFLLPVFLRLLPIIFRDRTEIARKHSERL